MYNTGMLLPASVLNSKDPDATLSAFFLKMSAGQLPYCANYRITNRFKELVQKRDQLSEETYKLILHHYLRNARTKNRLREIFGDELKLTREDAEVAAHNSKLFSDMIDEIGPLLNEEARAGLVTRLDRDLDAASAGRVSSAPDSEARKFLVNEAGAHAVEKYLKHPCMHDVLLNLPDLDAQSGRTILRMLRSSASSATQRQFLAAPSEALSGLQCVLAARSHYAPSNKYVDIPFHKTNMKFNMIMIKRLMRRIQRGKELK